MADRILSDDVDPPEMEKVYLRTQRPYEEGKPISIGLLNDQARNFAELSKYCHRLNQWDNKAQTKKQR